MQQHGTNDDTAETTPAHTPRYWPDGTEVTLDTEAALDRIIATVRRIQTKQAGRRP